jgi:hypothetical protein
MCGTLPIKEVADISCPLSSEAVRDRTAPSRPAQSFLIRFSIPWLDANASIKWQCASLPVLQASAPRTEVQRSVSV